MEPTTLPADLIREADRFLAYVAEYAEREPAERGYAATVTMPAHVRAKLRELLELAAATNAGWGVRLLDQRRWCKSADGDGEAYMVFPTRELAAAGAERESRMYHLGPCEARPFDLTMED